MATIGLTGGAGSTGGININGTERVTIDTSGNVTLTSGGVDLANVASINSGPLSGFRNKIIGGDFTTNPWQDGTSFVSPANGTYTADQWIFSNTSSAVVTISKQAAVSATTQNYLDIDITTADASIAAGDYAHIRQPIEGLNVACLGFGVAGTRYVTLSFEHAHTKTGTHCVSFRNSANNRSYVAEYTQSIANAWEKASITIPVDQSGTWLYDTDVGLNVSFALATGSTFQTTANTWAAGSYFATPSQVNNLDSTSNNFRIRQVQLEQGSVATAFEQRSAQAEDYLAKRYFEYSNMAICSYGHVATAQSGSSIYFVTKRALPTVTEVTNYTTQNVASLTFSQHRNNSVYAQALAAATAVTIRLSLISISARL